MRITIWLVTTFVLSAFIGTPLQAQPKVVYSSGSDLLLSAGDPGDSGSFTAVNQGSAQITDVAIDPTSGRIYYIDTLNGNIGYADSNGQRIGVLTETPVAPFVMRISGGVLYYSDRSLVPSIQTVNLSTGVEGSLPITDDIDHFVIDSKNGKVFYSTDSSTDEHIKSSNFDGSGVTDFFRPTTVTSALEIYGDSLLRSDFGSSGRISALTLPGLSPSTVVKAGQSGTGAAVDMASDAANGFIITSTTTLRLAGFTAAP